MKTISEWVLEAKPGASHRAALVVGKGPTSIHFPSDAPRSAFEVFTLNHAINLCIGAIDGQVAGAHFVDFEAYLDCWSTVAAYARFLIMPDRPHEKMNPGRPIEQLLKVYPALRKMDEEGRLVIYRKMGCHVGSATPGSVACLYFSAEALFCVLGMAGFSRVFSLGIDGGASYGPRFKDLKPLTNGQPSFDRQIPELYRIAAHYGFTWDRLYQGPEAKGE